MSALVEIDNISISFGGIKAVQNVSITIEKGQILGLIGPNGSGKSTCVNMISGVCKPDSGSITFEGHKLTDATTIAQRAKLGIGRTFQSPKPFANLTVYDNVFVAALAKFSHEEAARRTAYTLDLTDLAQDAQTSSAKLSIEKRKWLDLARVIATDPKLIMMDEVMAGLNPTEMGSSLDLVRRINKEGISVLFIEHVMKAVVSICTDTIVLNEGKKLCQGPPEEVLRRNQVIEAYIGGKTHENAEC